MQRIESVIEERPPRAAQVVPLEPSLRSRYRYLYYTGFILAIFIVNLVIAFHEVLLNYSFFNLTAVFYLINFITSISSFKRWRVLDQRRQQAARYNLTTGLPARASAPPRAEAPALPDLFVISTQRRWVLICILAFSLGLLICMAGVLTYSSAQSMLQEVPHGVSIAVVIWESALNVALVLLFCYVVFSLLVIYPRQQLMASRDGLSARRGYQTSFIPWHQARLFAIVGQASPGQQEPMLFYELASNDSVIRWPSTSTFLNHLRGTVPAGVTLLYSIQTRPASFATEFPQQIQFLNIIVAERTGLPLYDLR